MSTEEWGGTCQAATTTDKPCILATRTDGFLCTLHAGIAEREEYWQAVKARQKAERPMEYWAFRYPEPHARWCRKNYKPTHEYNTIPDQLMRRYLHEIGVSIALMEDQ